MSWTEATGGLRAWRRTRFQHALFLPASLTLAAASLVGAPPPSAIEILVRLLAAWAALLTLRLWDDLEDRDRDALAHPDRALAKATSTLPFALAVTLGVLLLAALSAWLGPTSLVAWASLCLGLLAFYRLRIHQRAGAHFLLLLKYPALVLLLRQGLDLDGAAAMALVYGGVAFDEALQGAPAAALGLSLFLGAAALLAWRVRDEPSFGLQVALASLTALVALVALHRARSIASPAPPGATRAALMGLTLLQLASFHWGLR